jgi:hypothetical protein
MLAQGVSLGGFVVAKFAAWPAASDLVAGRG